jgi:hypothetical protein
MICLMSDYRNSIILIGAFFLLFNVTLLLWFFSNTTLFQKEKYVLQSVQQPILNNTESLPDSDHPLALAEYYFAPSQYDLDKAKYYYHLATKKEPERSAIAWYQLSRIEFLRGNFDIGLSHLRQKISRFGDEIPNAYYMKGLIYAFRADWYGNRDDWNRSAEQFLTFLTYYPQSPWARIDLAWVYFSTEQYEEMRKILEPIKNQEVTNPWFLNMYALALFHNNELESAATTITNASHHIQAITTDDWATVYPENNPKDWAAGLEEFKIAIEKNLTLITSRNESGGREQVITNR